MTVGHLYIFFGNMPELLRRSTDEWLSGIRDGEGQGVDCKRKYKGDLCGDVLYFDWGC